MSRSYGHKKSCSKKGRSYIKRSKTCMNGAHRTKIRTHCNQFDSLVTCTLPKRVLRKSNWYI